jgi:hypothetical protein
VLVSRVRTQRAIRLVRQTRKGLRVFGVFAAWLTGRRWLVPLGTLEQPGNMAHQQEPDECDEYQLGEKKMRPHGNAPSYQCEMGALYRILTPPEFSARYGYTTEKTLDINVQMSRV